EDVNSLAKSSARTTASTTSESGSIKMTTSAPFAASAERSVACAPVAASCARATSDTSEPTTSYPCSASRCDIGDPMAPRPMKAMRRGLGVGMMVFDHRFGDAKGLERRRYANVHGGLEQRLLDLFGGDAVVERAAHVHAEFVGTIERGEHHYVEQAARL